jgi:hypothetical protein
MGRRSDLGEQKTGPRDVPRGRRGLGHTDERVVHVDSACDLPPFDSGLLARLDAWERGVRAYSPP